tara:strand:+ start:953 stop:2332 length:1380 start_codon:yes stop_codon:yes gene_type:complete
MRFSVQKNEEFGGISMRSREESRHKETREREVIRHTNMSSIPSSIDKDATEEEDSYASEILQRLDDLGVSIPPNTSPKTLRNHKHSPLEFTKIAQHLACAIGPLIKMTGADNVNLALQSCVTLKNIRGASYEDCASRALGALAVLATMLDERFRDKIGTFRVFEILVAYLQAARLMKESMEKKQREKEKTSQQTTKDEDKMTMKRPPTPNPLFNEVFRELEHAAGEKAYGYHAAHTAKEIAIGAKRVAETFAASAKDKSVLDKHKGQVVERREIEAMTEQEVEITREANDAIKAEFKKRKEMIAKRAGVSVQSLTKSSNNNNTNNSSNQGTKRTRKMEDLDSEKYENDAFSLASYDGGNGGDNLDIAFPDSLFDMRGADVAKSGLKAGSGRSRQKTRLVGDDGFDAKTVTIGAVPDRGGRVDESGRFVAKFKGGKPGGSKGETSEATTNNNKRQWRKRK